MGRWILWESRELFNDLFLEILSCTSFLLHAIKLLVAMSLLVEHWPAGRPPLWKRRAVFALQGCFVFVSRAGCLVYSTKELPFAVLVQQRSILFIWTHLLHLVRSFSICRPLSSQTEKTCPIPVTRVENVSTDLHILPAPRVFLMWVSTGGVPDSWCF